MQVNILLCCHGMLLQTLLPVDCYVCVPCAIRVQFLVKAVDFLFASLQKLLLK